MPAKIPRDIDILQTLTKLNFALSSLGDLHFRKLPPFFRKKSAVKKTLLAMVRVVDWYSMDRW